jgi:hypothetical protein
LPGEDARSEPAFRPGTIAGRANTGLPRWFLATSLLISSEDGISAVKLQRQTGFGSYQKSGRGAARGRGLGPLRLALVPDRESRGDAMGEVVEDETSNLTPDDHAAIAEYLLFPPPLERAPRAANSSSSTQ